MYSNRRHLLFHKRCFQMPDLLLVDATMASDERQRRAAGFAIADATEPVSKKQRRQSQKGGSVKDVPANRSPISFGRLRRLSRA